MATTINANNTDGVVITPDTSGELELQANGVTKAKVTANGLQDANGNSLRGGMYRNLIINGDMQIAQRGTSKTGINNDSYNTIDRWYYNSIGSTASAWTQSQSTDVPTGQGFGYSLKMQCTTSAPSDTEGASLEHRIESQMLQHLKFGTSFAESFTISFWVKSNKTGTFICEINQKDIDTVISRTYTINSADTWEKKTVTFVGDTSNAMDNDNTEGFRVAWWLYAGSTYNSGTLNTTWSDRATNASNRAVGQTNLVDSTSNYINITGVQLEIGEGSSNFEFLPYDVQLQRCERYYEISGGRWRGYDNGYTFVGTNFFKVTKRATPTVTQTGGSGSIGDITTVKCSSVIGGGNFDTSTFNLLINAEL